MSLGSTGQVLPKNGRKISNPRDASDAAGELCVSERIPQDVFTVTPQPMFDLKCLFTVRYNYHLVRLGKRDSVSHSLCVPWTVTIYPQEIPVGGKWEKTCQNILRGRDLD